VVFLRPRISVIGIGGAGSNTIDNMLRRGLTGASTRRSMHSFVRSFVRSMYIFIDGPLCLDDVGINYVVANTDAQALSKSIAPAECKVQIGRQITNGLGAGAKPAIGTRSVAASSRVLAALCWMNLSIDLATICVCVV